MKPDSSRTPRRPNPREAIHGLRHDAIEQAFHPLHTLLARHPFPGRHSWLGMDREETAEPVRSEERRRTTAQVLSAASAIWDALLAGAGFDLQKPLHIDEVARSRDPGMAGYADGMLTYRICEGIWTWNELEEQRSTDDLDREIARALVRIHDVMTAIAPRNDISKRSGEAIGDLLLARPATIDAMREEARHRRLSTILAEQIEDLRAHAESYRAARRTT